MYPPHNPCTQCCCCPPSTCPRDTHTRRWLAWSRRCHQGRSLPSCKHSSQPTPPSLQWLRTQLPCRRWTRSTPAGRQCTPSCQCCPGTCPPRRPCMQRCRCPPSMYPQDTHTRRWLAWSRRCPHHCHCYRRRSGLRPPPSLQWLRTQLPCRRWTRSTPAGRQCTPSCQCCLGTCPPRRPCTQRCRCPPSTCPQDTHTRRWLAWSRRCHQGRSLTNHKRSSQPPPPSLQWLRTQLPSKTNQTLPTKETE